MLNAEFLIVYAYIIVKVYHHHHCHSTLLPPFLPPHCCRHYHHHHHLPYHYHTTAQSPSPTPHQHCHHTAPQIPCQCHWHHHYHHVTAATISTITIVTTESTQHIATAAMLLPTQHVNKKIYIENKFQTHLLINISNSLIKFNTEDFLYTLRILFQIKKFIFQISIWSIPPNSSA